MPKLNREQLLSYSIPLAPLDTQREIVVEIEAERKLVDGNRELITRMEKKIQARLAEIWGEEAIDRIAPRTEQNDGLQDGKGTLIHAG